MIEEKINNFLNAPNESISFGNINKINFQETIKIYWGEETVGHLLSGSNISSPTAEALNNEYISSEKRLLIAAKLTKLDRRVNKSIAMAIKRSG